MSRTVRINATMDEELLRRIDAYAADRYEDRSTALRQLADFALRELQLRDAVEAYRQGRVSLREFASAMAVDVWKAHDLLRAAGVAVAQGSREESRGALDDLVADLVARPDGAQPGAGAAGPVQSSGSTPPGTSAGAVDHA